MDASLKVPFLKKTFFLIWMKLIKNNFRLGCTTFTCPSGLSKCPFVKQRCSFIEAKNSFWSTIWLNSFILVMKYLIANQEICKSKFSLLHKFNFLKKYIYVKDSEYPFKQNENMLKNKTVLLYTYFYNISLNVLRLTFFNVYNLPFLRSINYFFYFMSSCINKIAVFNIFFHWYVAIQKTNGTVPVIFFFSNIFLTVNYF